MGAGFVASPEEVSGFEKQIEKSLDYQVERLREVDVKKAEVIDKLKEAIMREARMDRVDDPNTPRVEEKYSADLRLSSKEMTFIYKEIFNSQKELLAENNIEDYSDFVSLIGFSMGTLFIKKLEAMKVAGHSIDIKLPLACSERAIESYRQSLVQINNADFLSIDSKLHLSAYGSGRLDFTILKNGEKVQYSAYPHGVFRVDKDLSKKDAIKVRQLHSELIRFDKINTKGKSAEQIKVIENKKEVVWKQYCKISDALKRDLFDEKSNKKIIEKSSAYVFLGESELSHYTFNDQKVLVGRIKYIFGSKAEEFEYFPGTKTTKKEIIFYKNGDKKIEKEFKLSPKKDKSVLVKIVYHHENRSKDVKEYSPHPNFNSIIITRSLRYRADGTLARVLIGKNEIRYNREGKPIYDKNVPGKNGELNDFIITDKGKKIGNFNYEKSKNPNLTEGEYLGLLKSVIKTREQFFGVEETFIVKKSGLNKRSIDELRLYGKKIAGVLKKEKALEKKYGIEIETENWPFVHRLLIYSKVDRIPIKLLMEEMNNLEAEMLIYPPGFIQKSGIETIYFFKQFSNNDKERAGGYGRTIFDKSIGISNVKFAFSHELYHYIDLSDKHIADNYEWGIKAHGKNHKKLYGKSGGEAIASGKANGKRPIGHPSAYGKYGGIDEDQADMAGKMLMNDPEVMKAIKTEKPMAIKAKLVKEFYYVKSGGKMDVTFWEDLANGVKINHTYWVKRYAANDYVKNSAFEKAKEKY